MSEHSKILTKLLDDIVHRPEEIRMVDVANLPVEELAVYMKFRAEQKRDSGSKLAKHVKNKLSTGPIREITKE